MNDQQSTEKLYRTASALAFITMAYNLIEGGVSAWLGAGDESLSLFGFGLDSFVEVVSGAGIWHMVRRQREQGGEGRDLFERRALRITGYGFFLLAAALLVSGIYDCYSHHAPRTTVWGILISLISMLSMWLLIHYKIKVGTALGSQAIIADAACTRVCLYLSVILLAASAGFEATGIGWFDAAGAFGISWLCLKEGREALGKAKGLTCGCSCNCS
jgi:divalent metal cation (Fe/Co/Zn/Cd) transporter